MKPIAALSILVCLSTGAASAATDRRARCADAVGMAGSKLASVSLKVLAQCRRDTAAAAACTASDPAMPKALARSLGKARQYVATTIRRDCRSLPPEQLPITVCPSDGVTIVRDVSILVACVGAVVDDRTAALVGDLFGVQAHCGDGVRAGGEQCDGVDAPTCADRCTAGCTCPKQIGSCLGGAEYGSCRTDADCEGRCNLGGDGCLGDTDCQADTCGRCSLTNETCAESADCAQPNVCTRNACTQNTCTDQCNAGLCSTTFKRCTVDADCPVLGYCQVSGDSCTSNTDCPPAAGYCSATGDACTTDADCRRAPGSCSYTGEPCAKPADCAANTCRPDVCRLSARTCTTDADCVVHCKGRCELAAYFTRPTACETAADCPNLNVCLKSTPFCFDGTCTSTGAACTTHADCVTPGFCYFSGETCAADADCPPAPFADYCDFGCEGTSASCTRDDDCKPRCSDPTPGFCLN